MDVCKDVNVPKVRDVRDVYRDVRTNLSLLNLKKDYEKDPNNVPKSNGLMVLFTSPSKMSAYVRYRVTTVGI